MEYEGKFVFFDFDRLKTYPLATRANKVTQEDLVWPADVSDEPEVLSFDRQELRAVAREIVKCRKQGLPVIVFTGAHLIKCGLSPVVADLITRGFVTLLATTGAGVIHDFELALIGETSEHVPRALPEGKFGMAEETGRYLNAILVAGNRLKLGFGEVVARAILGEELVAGGPGCRHPHLSLLATAYECAIPCTVHASIGTDITDQHPSFDGAAKGGCSGRDFGIFVAEVCNLTHGGVVLNIGSAVTGPEVLLKAMSMAANVGHRPDGIVTANFDLRPGDPEAVEDESRPGYYYRDVKSVVTRIPSAFGGRGYHIAAPHQETIPALYRLLATADRKG